MNDQFTATSYAALILIMVYQLHTACYILPTTYCLLVTTLWLTTVAGRTGCLEPSLAIFTSASVLVTFPS